MYVLLLMYMLTVHCHCLRKTHGIFFICSNGEGTSSSSSSPLEVIHSHYITYPFIIISPYLFLLIWLLFAVYKSCVCCRYYCCLLWNNCCVPFPSTIVTELYITKCGNNVVDATMYNACSKSNVRKTVTIVLCVLWWHLSFVIASLVFVLTLTITLMYHLYSKLVVYSKKMVTVI